MQRGRELSPLVPEMVALLGGIIMAFVVALPINTLIGRGVSPEILTVVVAPLVEEPTKVLGVVFLAMFYPLALAKKSKGIILGAMGGLGFGFLEGIFYVILRGADPAIRVWTIFAHMFWSGIVGIGVAIVASRAFDRSSFSTALGGFLGRALSMIFLPFLILGMFLHGTRNAAAVFIGGGAGIAVVVLVDLIALFCLYWLHIRLPEDVGTIDTSHISRAFLWRPAEGAPAPEVKPGARFCSYCGTSISPRALYCSSCGRKLR